MHDDVVDKTEPCQPGPNEFADERRQRPRWGNKAPFYKTKRKTTSRIRKQSQKRNRK